MKTIFRLIFGFAINILSLLAAAYFVSGFQLTSNYKGILLTGLIFTAINIFIRPILKIILSPVIFMTLGLGIIIVNALALYILDYFSQNVNIADIPSLIYSTLIISVINFVFHFISKRISD